MSDGDNISNNNNSSTSNGTTQRDPTPPPGAKWLTKPSDIKFLLKGEEEFDDDTQFFFTGLQRATDANLSIKRLYSVCIFMVSHMRYKPASNAYAKSAANNGHKDGNIERIIWLVDLFGMSGFNMAAMILQRGQSDSILFGNDRSMRDSEEAGVGSLWLIEGIPKITNYFDGDIPIIEINEPIKVVVPKKNVLPKPLVPTQEIRMHAFLLYGWKAALWNLHVFESVCKGPTCKALGTIHEKHCACFSKSESSCTLCLCLELKLTDPKKIEKDISIVNFTSKAFTMFCFKKNHIPKGISCSKFNSSRKLKFQMIDTVDKILKLVNEKEGWTIGGWLKRGKSRDEAQVQDQNVKTPTHIDSALATHHLTILKPTKVNDIEGLDELRFDANDLLPAQPAIPDEATTENDGTGGA